MQASEHLVNRGASRKIRIGGLRVLVRFERGSVLIDAILPRGEVYTKRTKG
jgi:hypothetical protein